MKQVFLYAVTVLIWGSTWIAIKFQLGQVDPMVSVIYRFGLAGALLLFFCRIRRLTLRFSFKEHFFMAMVGFFLFSMNYWLIYRAEAHLTSGLMAVIFSSLIFFNIANNALFLGAAIDLKMVAGALAGILGICLIFMPEIQGFSPGDKGMTGIGLGVASVLLSSFGNIVSARNTREKIPIIQANAFGMTYGTLTLTLIALCLGKDFGVSFSLSYTTSLVFLSVFGSIVAFGTYLTLVGSLGPDKASYAIMVVPVVALVISSFVENYAWTLSGITGLGLVLGGNFLALWKRSGQH
ncbi:MAG: DMT family transporter [Desulfobacter sp.]|nr:DMT family transporter [Desulfobacter sp.]WDP85592.1 MAG: DMT family transporter [Desulfobacter sp.]